MRKNIVFLPAACCVLLTGLPTLLTAQTNATSTIAGTVTTTSVANGFDWTNSTNIQNADAVYATSSITGSNRSTYYLDAKNWGFQTSTTGQANYIPPAAVINGIEVNITWRKTGTGNIRDNKIILLKAGAEAGNNNSRGSVLPTTAVTAKYGSNIDMWGTTWTAADLTNANFGVRIQGKNQGSRPAQAEVDYVRITVYFNQVFYYSKSTGNLELPATWGTGTDGAGTTPANFNTDGRVYFLRNRTTTSLTANLTISGSNSKLVIGDGTNPTTLTIPSNFALTAPTDIAAASAIIINNTTHPTLNSIATNTTVTYGAAGDQNVQEANYYNLTLSGSGNKLLQTGTTGFTSVNNVLTISPGITFNNQGNNVYITGSATGISNSGTASGSGRFVYTLQDVSTSITGSGACSYSNLEVDFSTTTSTRVLNLSNAATITGTLYLTDGAFGNSSNLTMANNSTIVIGDGTLGNNIASSGYNVIYNPYTTSSPKLSGNEITGTVRNLTLQTGSGLAITLNRNLVLTGTLTLSSGTLDPTTNNFQITIGGNFTNNASLTARNNIFTLNGAGVQTISAPASQGFYNLVVNNAAGGSVLLSTPISVSNVLTLTNGIITTSSTNTLTMGAGASISGANAGSYINGPLTGTLASTSGTLSFPVGKNGSYRLAGLSLSQVAATSTTYTAELFAGAPPARTLPAGLSNVSQLRYYTINCSNNSNVSSATATINYTSDGVTDAPNLRIAKSNGSNWQNIGGTGTAAGTGSITSGAFTTFSDFVLANTTGGFNALPLEWLSFTAAKDNYTVVLTWETGTEKNISRFEVQRSANGRDWTAINTQASNNFTYNKYKHTDDNPLPGTSFYRIRSVDQDGAIAYTTAATINLNENAKSITVAPNPAKGSSFSCLLNDAWLLQQKEVEVAIIDINGRTVAAYNKQPSPVMSFNHKLSRGNYVVSIKAGSYMVKTKLMIR